jgi:hypothetical protein
LFWLRKWKCNNSSIHKAVLSDLSSIKISSLTCLESWEALRTRNNRRRWKYNVTKRIRRSGS